MHSNSKHTAKVSLTQWGIEVSITLPKYEGESAAWEGSREFAAQFPKSLRVMGTALSTQYNYLDPACQNTGRVTVGYVKFQAKLYEDGVNGGKNETGIKRLKSFVKHCARLGIELQFTMPYTNSRTEDEYNELLAS